jgi:hypothetical protein
MIHKARQEVKIARDAWFEEVMREPVVSYLYFGVKWDAPAFEDSHEVPVPVGQQCLLCREVITAGESGLLMPYVGAGRLGDSSQHIECFLRSILGDVQHLEQRCSCYNPDAGPDDTGRTYRQEARETMEWIILHGV